MYDWDPLIRFLPDLRVVSYNFRPGAWNWQTALMDLAKVIEYFGLVRPAVVGHSLGGMVAALWATMHPECPLAVNLDGHTNPTGPVLRAFIDEQLDASGDPDLAALISAFDELDLIATYRATQCRLVVVSSTQPEFEQMLPDEVGAAFAAYRGEFAKQLGAAAADTPLLSLREIATGHDVHLAAPEQVAELIHAGLNQV
ncbi:alpha/beta hydrolase fold [Goodfellowiella coeruleoviolacea]|uniref:Alpha/beta hydrolase fold n=2 Tax=Goodfellowiella coeruleoviolacea TaxID=334858 RepID=A0AAE3GH83_9PSEU|nr:alpha/beta hydrolase fold [Goodfellowiella coeruleoviolacea]